MSDLVWAINPLNDSSQKLIERIQSFAYDVLNARNCEFNLSVDDDFCDFPINQNQRKNILLICKEAVNNAAKYSNADVVKLSVITPKTGYFKFVISDNGKGFRDDLKSGNGLITMKKRALELSELYKIQSTRSGTRIEFALGTKEKTTQA
jgi:signal transduction histidine kinase